MTDENQPDRPGMPPDEAPATLPFAPQEPPSAGEFPPVPGPAARAARRFRPSRFHILFAVGAVLVVAVVLLALMVFAPLIAPIKLGAARDAVAARSDAEIREVATRFARNFVTIDYRTIDADIRRIREDTTGRLRQQLGQIQEVIREPYRRTKSSSQGNTAEAEVLSRTEDAATVSVVVRFSVQNTKRREPQSVTRSLELTLVRTASGWKVADAGQPSLPTLEDS